MVPAAAYRAAQKILDERVGTTHDFRRRGGVEAAFIMAPAGVEWVQDRAVLWNRVEAHEKRSDARLGTEVRVAIPHELNQAEREQLVREFAQGLIDRYGVAIDVAIHEPSQQGDQRNWHAHLLMTTRAVTAEGFGSKTDFERTNGDLMRQGLPTTHQQVRDIRALWEHSANIALARAGREERIDMRSYAARGIDIEPTVHIGKTATALVRRGLAAEMAQVSEEARSFSAELLRIDPGKAIAVVERQQSVFDRRDVARVINRFISDPVLFQSVLARAMTHQSLIQLAPEFIDPSSGAVIQEARFATRGMVVAEHQMVRSAVAMSERGGFATREQTIGETLARFEMERGFALNPEQQQALRHVTADRGLGVVVGLAGTGKSTMLDAARQVYEAEGRRVIGGALAGKAAAELTKSSGIEARTLASWQARWEMGRDQLRAGDVLIIDEAGMVASRQMAQFIGRAEAAGAKVVLVGDPEQLQPIHAGAAFRAIAERTGYLELADIRRQREAWQREASIDLARGRVEQAISAYSSRGFVVASKAMEDVYERVASEWFESRDPDKSTLILAYRNRDVRALNERIRAERVARGEIEEGHEFAAVQRRTKPSERIDIEENSVEEQRSVRFAAGDRVVLGKGFGELKNGLLGTVAAARPNEIDVDLDTGMRVSINAESYPHVSHGYAMTIHKAQGVTADRSLVVASPVDNRHLAYVALSRHRDAAKLYYAEEDFKQIGLADGLARSESKQTTTDYRVDIDAFLERRGLESRRTIAELWGDYTDRARTFVQEQRARLDVLWHRLEAFAGWRQVAPRPTQNLFGEAADRGLPAVPGLSSGALAALAQVTSAHPNERSAAVHNATADPAIARELAAAASGIEQRFGPYRLALGLMIDAPEAKLAERYGAADAAAIVAHRDVVRALHVVHDQAETQRREILTRVSTSAGHNAPIIPAVHEFATTVEQYARAKAGEDSRYRDLLERATQRAHGAVQHADRLIAAIDTHIRAHAGEANAVERVSRFVLEEADRIATLRGSTRILDFSGRNERDQATRALDALQGMAAQAAGAFNARLERHRAAEEEHRRALAVAIPSLSKEALASIATIERAKNDAPQLQKLLSELDRDTAIKDELGRHNQAMRHRFGWDYQRRRFDEQAQLRMPDGNEAQYEAARRPARVLYEAQQEIQRAEAARQAQERGQAF